MIFTTKKFFSTPTPSVLSSSSLQADRDPFKRSSTPHSPSSSSSSSRISSSSAATSVGSDSRSQNKRLSTSSPQTIRGSDRNHNKEIQDSMGLFGKSPAPFIKEDEELCCCGEPLSLRLAREKTIIPICGHKLHEACYEAIYGPISQGGRNQRNKPVGVCGVCRANMVISEETYGGSGKNKFAAISGLPQASSSDNFKMKSVSRQTLDIDSTSTTSDSFQDDPIFSPNSHSTFPSSSALDRSQASSSSMKRGTVLTTKVRSDQGSSSEGWNVVRPIIKVQAEYPTISRSPEEETKGHLTCMVTIKMPSRWSPSSTSPGISHSHSDVSDPFTSPRQNRRSTKSSHSSAMSPRPSSPTESAVSNQTYGSTAAGDVLPTPSNPFLSVVEDLHKRLADWKGHGGQPGGSPNSPPDFGMLKLYDYVNIRKGPKEHEFLVYLFEDAILCITDDKRNGKLDSTGKPSDRLRLKGRIYTRHINSVIDTSGPESLSLTINMQDEGLDQFVIVFRDIHSLNVWKSQIDLLVESIHGSTAPAATSGRARFGMVSSPSANSMNSDFSESSSYYSTYRANSNLPPSSSLLRERSSSTQPGTSTIREERSIELSRFNSASSPPSSLYASSSYSNPPLSVPASPLGSRDFTSLDLMLILSIPQTTLQLNILKNTLEFVLQTVGSKTRISIVSYASPENVLRKTPFIAVGTDFGRARLEEAINSLGRDSSAMFDHKEDSVNVVSAVNCALDIVLQRKSKSALTGMILMNDGSDTTQRSNMDLVLARAESANLPIHSIGWGRAVDPSSLWLLSNHTGGTHTFVREFYELRDVMAGIVGGLLSIAATTVNIHISVPEKKWFKIRKVSGTTGTTSGALGAVVSSEGFDVHIPIGELRFGETKELLVELEMSIERPPPPVEIEKSNNFSSATDEFFLRNVGIDLMTLESSNFYEQEYAEMATDVPLFEVECSYRDPAANKMVSRVNSTPTLLTVTLNPSSTKPIAPVSNPSIVRRRMELLTADMLTRTLLLMSRRNDTQAQRLLTETKRIISTISATLAPGRSRHTSPEELEAHSVLLACAEDVSLVLTACSNREEFDSQNWRSFAAQQAVVLRDQKAWSDRTRTEALKWKTDHSIWFAQASQSWISARA